ncbi:response regulator [Pedobacter chinensis]|uniref:Response regulator n=1 Tax=Pedobacter chinensis TaxID=2282421 RepID=A0A369Q059_9SPHI|nr:response regulator transcription factor [Pedobacter chinensis]RDC57882.1 response regulator [Pedobacter chinensis]
MRDKVLIVDSEILINKFLESRLTKENINVDVAFDGIQAVEKIQNEKYDLILTDLMLPYVTGIELIMKIKKSENNQGTPVVVLSSLSAEDVIVDVLAIGAQDYIIKPFSINVVLAKIKQLIQLNKTAA